MSKVNRPEHVGLRHVALIVHDYEAMRRFYTEVLGFTIEWEPDPDNVYLTSGIDNVALHRSPVAQTEPLAAPSRLDHIGLVVRAADDVDRWAAFLESRGVTIDAAPRTHRDGARSCYFRDPDGNRIQILHHPPIS